MQDNFLDFFLDLLFRTLHFLTVLKNWLVAAKEAKDAFDQFLIDAGVPLLMETVFPWLFSTVERTTTSTTPVICAIVRLALASVKAAVVTALWIAYAHVVVVYLLVVAATVRLISTLWALIAVALDTAISSAMVVRFTAVSLAAYILASVPRILSTVSSPPQSLAIITYHFSTGFVIVPYLAWTAITWAISVVTGVLPTLLVATQRMASAAFVGVHVVATASATYILARATDLLKMLGAAVCVLGDLIQRLSTDFMVAMRFVFAALHVFASKTKALCHVIRLVYRDRVFHTTDSSASLNCLCVLLVPTSLGLGEWSVVRLGVQIYTEKSETTSTTTMPNSLTTDDDQNQNNEERATGELLAPTTEGQSDSTGRHTWSLRLETCTVWMCEVVPVVRPMGAVSWARHSALTSVPVDRLASTPDRATAEATAEDTTEVAGVAPVVVRLPVLAPARPPFVTLLMPAIVVAFLEAASNSLLRDQVRVMHGVKAIMAAPEGEREGEFRVDDKEDQDDDDPIHVLEDQAELEDAVQLGVEAAMGNVQNVIPQDQQLLRPARELEAVGHDDELEQQQPEYPRQDQAEPDAPEQAPVDMPAGIEDQPPQEEEANEQAHFDEQQPPAAAPVEEPLPPRIPAPRAAVRLPLLRRIAVRPEGAGQGRGAVQGGHAEHADQAAGVEAKTHRAARAAAAKPEPVAIVVEHGYDYERKPASRVFEYEQTAAYRKRREESLAMRRNRGNVCPPPAA